MTVQRRTTKSRGAGVAVTSQPRFKYEAGFRHPGERANPVSPDASVSSHASVRTTSIEAFRLPTSRDWILDFAGMTYSSPVTWPVTERMIQTSDGSEHLALYRSGLDTLCYNATVWIDTTSWASVNWLSTCWARASGGRPSPDVPLAPLQIERTACWLYSTGRAFPATSG
jgi:hypothetical protein